MRKKSYLHIYLGVTASVVVLVCAYYVDVRTQLNEWLALKKEKLTVSNQIASSPLDKNKKNISIHQSVSDENQVLKIVVENDLVCESIKETNKNEIEVIVSGRLKQLIHFLLSMREEKQNFLLNDFSLHVKEEGFIRLVSRWRTGAENFPQPDIKINWKNLTNSFASQSELEEAFISPVKINSLQSTSFKQWKFYGCLQQGQDLFAIMHVLNQQVILLKVNDLFGLEKARVVRIERELLIAEYQNHLIRFDLF